MVRPRNERRIGHRPWAKLYKPAGIPAANLDYVQLDIDEFEAMRLVDGEGLQQTEAAEQMSISRSSVGRLLESGRRKVALALAYGQAMKIQEGESPVSYNIRPPGRGHGRGGRRRGRRRGRRGM